MEDFFIRFFTEFPVLGSFTNSNSLAWPISEVFHFLGLTLLVGAIGVLDLRMLGLAKGLTPASVHRLVPIGIIGFTFNVLSGLMFVVASPTTFIPNPVFQLKMLFILLAGINVVFFYIAMFKKTEAVPAGGDAPVGAKVVAGVSICLWIGVIITGRFMAWF